MQSNYNRVYGLACMLKNFIGRMTTKFLCATYTCTLELGVIKMGDVLPFSSKLNEPTTRTYKARRAYYSLHYQGFLCIEDSRVRFSLKSSFFLYRGQQSVFPHKRLCPPPPQIIIVLQKNGHTCSSRF